MSITTTIAQSLEERGYCVTQTTGVSMEPLLHDHASTVVLEKRKPPYHIGDVVLFRRERHRGDEQGWDYVLHRIIGVRKSTLLIRGDNCIETDITSEDSVLGVMTVFFDGETYVDCAKDKGYLRYMKTVHRRFIFRWIRAFPRRVLRRLKRIFYSQFE